MEFKRKKIPSYLMLGTIALVVIWFNVSYFSHRISSNPQSISEYDLSDEDVAPPEDAATAGIFYPADIYQQRGADGFIKQQPAANPYCPKIMVLPHFGYRYASKIANSSYRRLASCADKIKTVFILTPAHSEIEAVWLPKATVLKTPRGEIKVNKEIVGELAANDAIFRKKKHILQQNSALKIQLVYLQQTLHNFKVVPLSYGKIVAKELAEILSAYLKEPQSLLIISADLNQSITGNDKPQENTDTDMTINPHNDCGNAAIETAKLLAKSLGLVPQMIDVTNTATEQRLSDGFAGSGWVYEETMPVVELQGLELYDHNVQNFARHQHSDLLQVVNNSIKSAKKHRHYRVKRKQYSDYMFNRGASLITAYFSNNESLSFGSLVGLKAIAADISDNIYRLLMENEALKTKGGLDAISIELLTDLEEVEYDSLDDLLAQIIPHKDGVVIRSGEREGMLPPASWKNYKTKEEFLTNLKIKAGLSPTYWSDDVKIFRFRTVEVKQ
ncbi:MAG: AmmeMemoRadiSam system protein B [Alphaproteobacteria bacterium]|nr:AmmeMemoRadiSam system protein B [Alphaproteobacteria bacterium]MBQ9234928.1 AmmeMemoRadiSam system protein B [Alphaproteobacteria bacterium]